MQSCRYACNRKGGLLILYVTSPSSPRLHLRTPFSDMPAPCLCSVMPAHAHLSRHFHHMSLQTGDFNELYKIVRMLTTGAVRPEGAPEGQAQQQQQQEQELGDDTLKISGYLGGIATLLLLSIHMHEVGVTIHHVNGVRAGALSSRLYSVSVPASCHLINHFLVHVWQELLNLIAAGEEFITDAEEQLGAVIGDIIRSQRPLEVADLRKCSLFDADALAFRNLSGLAEHWAKDHKDLLLIALQSLLLHAAQPHEANGVLDLVATPEEAVHLVAEALGGQDLERMQRVLQEGDARFDGRMFRVDLTVTKVRLLFVTARCHLSNRLCLYTTPSLQLLSLRLLCASLRVSPPTWQMRAWRGRPRRVRGCHVCWPPSIGQALPLPPSPNASTTCSKSATRYAATPPYSHTHHLSIPLYACG